MKATEFAEFFDLTIELNSKQNKGYEDYEPTKYIVRDNYDFWSSFPRFIDDVSDLVWCVDLMCDDYVLHDLEDFYGFEYDCDNDERTIYEAAADFATNRIYPSVSYADVVRCIANYEDIEDDVA